MKQVIPVRVFFLFLVTAACLLPPVSGQSAPQAAPDSGVTLADVAPGQVDAVLAKLSDEQVRSLLIDELQKEAVSGKEDQRPAGGIYAVFVHWLKMMNSEAGDMDRRIDSVRGKIGQVPRDLVQVAVKVGGEKGVAGFWLALGMVAGVLLCAYVVELFFRAVSRKAWGEFWEREAPKLDGLLRFWAAVFRILPDVVNIIVFLAAAFLLVVFVPGFGHPEIRMLFLALLVPLAVVRLFFIFSHLVCAPDAALLRLLPIHDSTALFLHRAVLFFVSYVAFVIMFLAFISQMGMPQDTSILVQIVAGTVLIVILTFMILSRRRAVAEAILSDTPADDESYWVKSRYASFWHILALSYLFIIWLIWTGQVIDGTARSGSFLLSLFVVPVFFVLDGLGQWVVRAAIGTLRIYAVEEEMEQQEAIAVAAGEEASRQSIELTAGEKRDRLIRRAGRGMRLAIIIALGVWILDLWGVRLPFAAGLVRAVFESLVTMTLALMAWRFSSSYI